MKNELLGTFLCKECGKKIRVLKLCNHCLKKRAKKSDLIQWERYIFVVGAKGKFTKEIKEPKFNIEKGKNE